MRNQEPGKRTSKAIALAFGALMTMLAAPAHAISSSVAVLGSSVSGSSVNVTVKNYTILPQARTVTVQAVVNGSTVSTSVAVVLLPYQTATVRAGFSAVVSMVGSVGITDEATPY